METGILFACKILSYSSGSFWQGLVRLFSALVCIQVVRFKDEPDRQQSLEFTHMQGKSVVDSGFHPGEFSLDHYDNVPSQMS